MAASQRTGIQSIEVGSPLLSALVRSRSPMSLSAVAPEAGLTPSKAHKYLTSYVRIGLIKQDAAGRYSLGPLALECGFAALRQTNVVETCQPFLEELRNALGVSASLTIWGNNGPTIVRTVLNQQPVSLFVRLGWSLPLLTSSNGRIFAAYLDRGMTGEFIKKELADKEGAASRAGLRRAKDVDRLAETVRREGYAVSSQALQPDMVGISAPVLDYSKALTAALTLVGGKAAMDPAPDSRQVTLLRAAAADLSCTLGYSAEVSSRVAAVKSRKAPSPY